MGSWGQRYALPSYFNTRQWDTHFWSSLFWVSLWSFDFSTKNCYTCLKRDSLGPRPFGLSGPIRLIEPCQDRLTSFCVVSEDRIQTGKGSVVSSASAEKSKYIKHIHTDGAAPGAVKNSVSCSRTIRPIRTSSRRLYLLSYSLSKGVFNISAYDVLKEEFILYHNSCQLPFS